jgi:hypothetical protein
MSDKESIKLSETDEGPEACRDNFFEEMEENIIRSFSDAPSENDHISLCSNNTLVWIAQSLSRDEGSKSRSRKYFPNIST